LHVERPVLLGLALCGGLGFLVVRPELFAMGDPARTAANLLQHESLARVGIGLELGVATFQALAALWFAKLFRETDAFAAGALASFGLVNSVALLVSAALLRAAFDAAGGDGGVAIEASHMLILLSTRVWEVANVFFGLWLIPMGWLTWKTRLGPRALGWILIIGGLAYIPLPFIGVLAPNAGAWIGVLPIAATIGEIWMIGLLLWRGMKPSAQPGTNFGHPSIS
jgi:hypothetical protein